MKRSIPARSANKTGGLRFRKVLVPLDFSDEAGAALSYAGKFAAQYGSQLVLLHVVEPMVYPSELGYPSLAALPPQIEYERAGRTGLARLARQLPAGVKADTRIRVGQPYIEIVEAAKDPGVDLIIISTHGRSGLAHVLMGSTAERVVRHAPVPVLTIRAPGKQMRGKRARR